MDGVEVSGWEPQWLTAREQLDRQRDRLVGRRGRRIVDTWVVWDLEHDEWFADLPVVLVFDDGRRLEVSWRKFDDLSITWNTIDPTVVPTVAWPLWPLAWRSPGHDALRAVIGTTVTDVASTEHRFTTRQISPEPRPGDETAATWLVGGLWLGTDGAGLHIVNALDENGVTNNPAPVDADHRVSPV